MSLEQLLEDGVIEEVVGRLKSGKEADVWLVRHHDEVLCAKVYKDRQFRSFKNNSGYKEGRAVRNTRTQRAMDRGSRFGQAAAEEAWKSAESDALHKLHAQGVRVPAPVLFYEGILLMKLVLDAQGHPAPRLIDAPVTREEAGPLYADLRQQAVMMLCAELIHGDLSSYNVLLGAEGPTIIDFPQVVSAAHNSTAESYFRRDVENLRTFFAGFDPALETRSGDAQEIWRAYVRRELTADFVPSGRPPPPPPQPRRHPRPQERQTQNPRSQGQHPRPQGQHAPQQRRPQGQHAPQPPRPQGQPHPPHPQQLARPHGQHPQPTPRPHGQHPQAASKQQRPHEKRTPQHQAQRPPGQQPQRAAPPSSRPAQQPGQQRPRPGARQGPVVERVHHHVPHHRPRPPEK